MVFIMIISVIFMLIFMGVVLVISVKIDSNDNSMTSYECGFDPVMMTRRVFSYRFFLIAVLFLIFDVEITLMIPIPYFMLSLISLWVLHMFLVILVVGLFYEMYNGVLSWAN